MDRRTMLVILNQIMIARDAVQEGIYYDDSEEAPDDPFNSMYYELDNMCVLISNMLYERCEHD